MADIKSRSIGINTTHNFRDGSAVSLQFWRRDTTHNFRDGSAVSLQFWRRD